MTYLAVAIAAPDTDAALVAMQQVAGVADLVELRLDLMQTFRLRRLLMERPLPVIVTCRPAREGGQWRGDEAKRMAFVHFASVLGADYVDVEWDTASLLRIMERRRTRVILSHHDLKGMPPNLFEWAERLWRKGADVIKIVGTAHCLDDIVPILQLLAEAREPTIAIAMGPYGLVTRLLAFRFAQALLSFAAPGPSPDSSVALAGTAPGQLTVKVMRELYRVQSWDDETALIGLLAPDANVSPLLIAGNNWLVEQRINAALLPLQPAPEEMPQQALQVLIALGLLRGYLVEPPYTLYAEQLFPTLDRLAAKPEVRTRGNEEVNTVAATAGQCRGACISDLAERLRWLLGAG